jgi:hypothetical protein
MTILNADCRALMPDHGPFEMILTDPRYGGTSLTWDLQIHGWLTLCRLSRRRALGCAIDAQTAAHARDRLAALVRFSAGATP